MNGLKSADIDCGLTKHDLRQVIAALAIWAWRGCRVLVAGIAGALVGGICRDSRGSVFVGVIKQAMPRHLTKIIFILLGLQIGGAVTPETLNTLSRWPLSFMMLALTMVVLVWSGVVFLRRVMASDRATSYFAVMPGALSVALALAIARARTSRK